MRSCCESNNCSLQSSANLWGKLAEAANSSIQFHRHLGGNSRRGKETNNLQMKQLLISCVTTAHHHHSGGQMQMHESLGKMPQKLSFFQLCPLASPSRLEQWLALHGCQEAAVLQPPMRAVPRDARFIFLPPRLQGWPEELVLIPWDAPTPAAGLQLQEHRCSEPSRLRASQLLRPCLCSLLFGNQPDPSSELSLTEAAPRFPWHTSPKRQKEGCKCPEMPLKHQKPGLCPLLYFHL